MPLGIAFEPAAITTLSIVFIPEIVQAIGDYTSLTAGAMDKEPKTNELQREIVTHSLATM